ncbi:MAG: phosphotransferase [Syntrophobacterales bacterium]|jgi:homoserine kinase type II|nr:phosphotransferase [Syntrophobacterales bacterium]
MLKLTELNTSQLFELSAQNENLMNIAAEFKATVDLALLRNQVVDAFAFYDLGEVKEVYQIFGGYVNTSFGVYTEKDGKKYEYFVRKYKKGIQENEMELEHSLIDFSIANGLDIAAGLIRSKEGKTFVKLPESYHGQVAYRYFAVYDFLEGEDKYTWLDPYLTDEEFASYAGVMATLHNASRNYDPKGRERVEPKILDFLKILPGIFKEYSETDIHNKFHSFYQQNLDDILTAIGRVNISDADAAKMPRNPVHCDYHPGNVKFRDGKVVGIFDFDWAKIDVRLFDVCFCLVYSCCAWEDLPDGSRDGDLRLDKCRIFLQNYQNKLKELGELEPLNETEKKHFPAMVEAANVYLINWCLSTYYSDVKNYNVYEYLAYLTHQIKMMHWINAHKADFAEIAASI